ncbi:MAG: right-handed parallel beta-helix repeat-containing protein [Parvibaculum sp.]
MTGRSWAHFAAGVVASVLLASPAHADKWSPWVEAGGFLSTERDRGEATAFMPLLQSERGLLFADVKGKLFSESVKEGNFALGYRHMTEPGWNLGFWGGYDIRESETGNTFSQLAFGLEALSVDYDARLNGYVPTSDPKAGGGLATVQLVGSQILMSGGREVPLWGIEGELGWRLPLENIGADAERNEFRLYAGGYRFDDDELSKPVQGPRVRAEWRINEIIPALAGSRLSFETSFQHDDYRDDQWEAGFRLRIPLFAGDTPKNLAPIERRMTEALVRDTDIVTVPSKTEKVADARTGVAFDRVERVDGTGDLEAVANAAGANSLIIVDGGNGDVAGGVIGSDQTIAGAGSMLALRGLTSGTLVNFAIPGTMPTLIASGCGCGDVFELLGSNLHFTGLLVDGDMGTSPLGFFLDSGQTNLHFTNMEIRGMSFAAIGGDEDNEIFVDGVTFSENVTGIYVENRNQVSVRNSVMDVLLLAGITANSDNTIVVENVEIREVDAGSAIRVNNGNTIIIDNALFETMWDSGIEGDSGNAIVATNLTVRDTGWNSINLNMGNTLALTNSTLEESDNDGLSAISGNDLTLSGVTFRNIALSAIYVEDSNALAMSDSVFEGTVGEDILTVDDTGNVLSGSGNENNAAVGNNLCTAAPGSFTGTIGFDGGPDIVDGSCP